MIEDFLNSFLIEVIMFSTLAGLATLFVKAKTKKLQEDKKEEEQIK